MADRRQKLVTEVEVDTSKAEGGLKKLGKSADTAAVDVGQLAKELKQADKPMKDLGDQADRTAHDVDSAFDRTGESAFTAASNIGEAFGGQGGAAQAVGGLTEIIEEVAGSFGLIGVPVAIAGAAIVSGIQSVLERSRQRAEELKQTITDMFDTMIEGAGKLDDAYKDDALKKFIEGNLELAKQLETQLPGSLGLVREALGGNENAYNTLTSTIQQNIEALNRQRLGGVSLTPELQRQYDALVALQGTIEDNNGALNTARTQTALYTNAVNTNTGSLYANEQQARRTNAARIGTAGVRGGTQQYYDYAANRAAGGPVTAGTPYVVGEYGRETFIPSTDGTIVPGTAAAAPITVLHQTIVTNDPVRVATLTARALRRQQFRGG